MRDFSIKKGLKAFCNLFFWDYSKSELGGFDKSSFIAEGCVMSNPSNIFIEDHVNIGAQSVLYATNASITIKKYFVSAIGLKISTGQHERRIGRFLSSITEEEKNHSIELDKPVLINEDVWAGFNVTILAGVEIGRGCTLAAGTVVTKSTPPYSIIGGVPSRFIRFYWSIEEILKHEEQLYEPQERYTKEQLEHIFKKYSR